MQELPGDDTKLNIGAIMDSNEKLHLTGPDGKKSVVQRIWGEAVRFIDFQKVLNSR